MTNTTESDILYSHQETRKYQMSKSFNSSYDDETHVSRDRKREKEDWKAARRAKEQRRHFEQGDE